MRTYLPFILIFISFGCMQQPESIRETTPKMIADHDYLRDFEPLTESGLVNVVIEIPAGDHQKWEVNKESGFLEWELATDTLREINYMGYPANYGMVPRTWLPIDQGGDDDPIDVILLGKTAERGSVIPSRVVGVIKMVDRGEQDDKLIAIDPKSHFYDVHTLEDLQTLYPGVVDILTIWFESYKGGSLVEIQSVEGESRAMFILVQSIQSYKDLYE